MKKKNDDFFNLNKDNGGFFSPVKGGHQDGLEFGKWMMHGSRIGLISLFTVSLILFSLFAGPASEFDPEWTFNGIKIFLGSIDVLIVFKTLQHWNDLKNHTSR
jgi:hypothetical protein